MSYETILEELQGGVITPDAVAGFLAANFKKSIPSDPEPVNLSAEADKVEIPTVRRFKLPVSRPSFIPASQS